MRIVTLFFVLFIFSAVAWSRPADEQLLAQADKFRNRWPSFTLKTVISEYKDNEALKTSAFQVLIKGSDKSLVRFLEADSKGQYLLMDGDNMWLFMPATRRPIRVTPLQKLAGNAANGDVARVNFSRDYEVAAVAEEDLAGVPCYRLDLEAATASATYRRIAFWIRADSCRPVQAELYLASGRRCKSISYEEYEIIAGLPTMTRMKIIDRLRPGYFSILKFSDYEVVDIPDRYFSKNYLPRLK